MTDLESQVFVGVDLAWGERGRTGMAALDSSGRLLDVVDARSDDELLAWLAPYTAGPCLVAIDAPLVVTNVTGRRPCEAALNAVFGRYDAGAHPSNTSRPELRNGSRALRLAERLDLDTDQASSAARRAIEVYPHPATVALFRLDRTIKYKHKPGRDLEALRAESLRFLRLLEGLAGADPALDIVGHRGWRALATRVEDARRKSELRAVEDAVDAVLCAYVGLFATRRPGDTTTYGVGATGYIVTPTLPDDAPPRAPDDAPGPPRRRQRPSPGSAEAPAAP